MEPKLSRITTPGPTRIAGLAASLVVILCGLSACTMVDDRLTGVRIEPLKGKGASCIHTCEETAHQALKEEAALHVTRVRACDTDRECLRAEKDRHIAAVRSIHAARKDCKSQCHKQGRGGDDDD